jgi:hypothetical protein
MTAPLTLGDGVGRSALIGAAVGFVVLAVLVTTGGHLLGLEPIDSLAIGTMVAVWAGCGFGSMYGAIAAITRNERLALAKAEPLGVGE